MNAMNAQPLKKKKTSVNLLKPRLMCQASCSSLILKQNFGTMLPKLLVKATVRCEKLDFSNRLPLVNMKRTNIITNYKCKTNQKYERKEKNYNKIKIKTRFYILFRNEQKYLIKNYFSIMAIFIFCFSYGLFFYAHPCEGLNHYDKWGSAQNDVDICIQKPSIQSFTRNMFKVVFRI